jgi:dTDP-4-dehydrorhamnose reductase
MRIVVVGSGGQLGSEMLRAAGEHGHAATGLTHNDIDIDIAKSVDDALLQCGQFDAVINCAAYVRVNDAEDHAEEAFQTNVIGALNLAKAAVRHQAKLIHLSTDFVFDGNSDSPISEDQVPNPINVYGVSKWAGENLVTQISESNLIVRVASLFGIAGASGKSGGNFISAVLGIAAKTGQVSAVNDLFISPTYAADAAEAIVGLAEADASGICHVVNTGVCTWFDLAEYVVSRVYPTAKITSVGADKFPTVAARPRYTALSTRRLVDEFGINMRSWELAVSDFLSAAGYIDDTESEIGE